MTLRILAQVVVSSLLALGTGIARQPTLEEIRHDVTANLDRVVDGPVTIAWSIAETKLPGSIELNEANLSVVDTDISRVEKLRDTEQNAVRLRTLRNIRKSLATSIASAAGRDEYKSGDYRAQLFSNENGFRVRWFDALESKDCIFPEDIGLFEPLGEHSQEVGMNTFTHNFVAGKSVSTISNPRRAVVTRKPIGDFLAFNNLFMDPSVNLPVPMPFEFDDDRYSTVFDLLLGLNGHVGLDETVTQIDDDHYRIHGIWAPEERSDSKALGKEYQVEIDRTKSLMPTKIKWRSIGFNQGKPVAIWADPQFWHVVWKIEYAKFDDNGFYPVRSIGDTFGYMPSETEYASAGAPDFLLSFITADKRDPVQIRHVRRTEIIVTRFLKWQNDEKFVIDLPAGIPGRDETKNPE